MISNRKTNIILNDESVITLLNPSEEERAEAWAYLIDNNVKLNGWMELQKQEIIKEKIITKKGSETTIDWTKTKKIN